MSILVDTNILLRRMQPDLPQYAEAVESVALLLEADEVLHFTAQVAAEFWNVVTRPAANNGMGLTPSVAAAELRKLECFLDLLPETPASYEQWKHLVANHEVRGVKVHDARLVAVMMAHGVTRLLIFNTRDFERYGIEAVHPSSLLQTHS